MGIMTKKIFGASNQKPPLDLPPAVMVKKSNDSFMSRGQAIMVAVVLFVLFTCVAVRLIYITIIGQNLICFDVDKTKLIPSKDLVLSYTDKGDVQIRIKGTTQRLPQAIVVGVRKSGTRALLEFLNMHSQIRAAKEEIHYFDNEDNYRNGLEWYRKRMPFSFPDQITIEKSPAYFITEGVPERIAAMNSSVKLMLIVKNPTKRTISDYTQVHYNKLSRNKSHSSFEELAIDQATGVVNTHLKAIRTSLYHRHLERWLNVFNRNQILIVDGDALITNPIPQIKRVEDFLGLENQITRDNFYFNKTKGFYCMKDNGQDHCLGSGKGRKHPDVDPSVIHKLNKFFHPHNERFFDMVGQRLDWPKV